MKTPQGRAAGQLGGVARRTRLLIVELGAPPLRAEGADQFDETVAIAQARGELPLAFANRTLERIAMAERTGRCFDSAVVLTGSRHDASSCAARRLIALGLATHGKSPRRLTELRLEAGEEVEELGRAKLWGLVEELNSEHQAVPIRLRFGASAGSDAESGVFWRVPPSQS